MYYNRMLKLYFYFLQFLLKIQSCEKSVKDKSFGEKPKPANYVIFFAILRLCQDVLRKLPKLANILSIVPIIYLS